MIPISKTDIQYLKRYISLTSLIQSSGVKLKRVGASWTGVCPFHIEKHGSLVVSPNKNLFHCFGCGAAGSSIDWIMQTKGMGFRQAVEWLARENNISLAQLTELENQAEGKEEKEMPDRVEIERTVEKSDAELLNQAVELYHEVLKKSQVALGYLESRGLNNSEMIDKFRLGYSNRSLLTELPAQRNQATNKLRERWQEVGLLRETGHEHFNNCIIVPIFNELGEVVEIYGRKVVTTVRSDMPLHLYMKGPHRGVWNAQDLLSNGYKEVILCEALLDALTFWMMGYRNVTSSYGVEGFTSEHLSLFKQLKIERVLVAYDSDEAGNNAATKLAKRLTTEGIACSRIDFPIDRKDANATFQIMLGS